MCNGQVLYPCSPSCLIKRVSLHRTSAPDVGAKFPQRAPWLGLLVCLPGNWDWDWDWDVAGASSRVLQGREPNINGDVLRRGGEDRHHDGCCSLRTGRFGSSRLFQGNVERWIV